MVHDPYYLMGWMGFRASFYPCVERLIGLMKDPVPQGVEAGSDHDFCAFHALFAGSTFCPC